MNIKQHIEAGHYPKTGEGMEIVQTSEGLTVHVADVHPDGRIAGWLSTGDPSAYTWNARGGAFQEHGGDLLPPAPRKVEVVRYAEVRLEDGYVKGCFGPTVSPAHGCVMVKLTGSYEEPWS